ncbi:formate dehydrogenase subunit alpha [Candidatus Omnitrophota bacterium]
MHSISLTIDNKKITAKKGMTILEAALSNNIYIPHLCYHPDLKPVSVCRVCMVEVKCKGLVISCQVPVEEGLEVATNSPEADKVRRVAAELLCVNHTFDKSDNNLERPNELLKVMDYLGITKEDIKRLRKPDIKRELDTSNPFFERDLNKCILCGICVRTCDELEGIGAIDFVYRGIETTIGTFDNGPLVESNCEACGECLVRCPTAALRLKKFTRPEKEVKTTCVYCGVGCGVYLGVRNKKIVSARGDRDNTVNKGMLCVKGRFGYEFIHHPDRLTSPLIKKNGKFVKATWDKALDLIAEKFSQCKPEEFAALSSAKCTNEENYIMQKFTRAVMGTNTIDHCARLCHAPTVAGLVQSFGSGAMTNSINEIPHAACMFAIGTNTTEAHPVIALKMKDAVKNGATLIVANPKEIDLCKHADMFLQHRPGSDVALMMGMMRVIVDEGLHDEAFIESNTENFQEFKESLKNFDLDFVQSVTDVPKEKIIEAARCYATNKPAAIFYAMGITQHTHGTDNVLATSNLALLAGNVGKPSSGVNPLRGQNNVQGACDIGALPNVYPGYQKVSDAKIKEKFESAWGVRLSDKVGLTHLEISDAICDGEIKMLYIMGENPILSEANAAHVKDALKKVKFFVAQDLFMSETAEFADVILPAVSFAEKDGTYTNTERRVQRVRKAIEPIGNAEPDWWITCQIAKRLKAKGFDFSHPSQIMDEIASVTPSYQGISFERIDDVGLQWPCVSAEHPGTQFLHSNKFATQSGKGRFKPLEYKPPAEVPDEDYSLTLTTDRSLYLFHTNTLTRRVKGLDALNSQELVKINPIDAEKLRINDGDMVRVISRRGKVKVKAKLTDICPEGVVSMTFHFAESPTNVMTNAAFDPVAKIPETKVCAVRIEKLRRKRA